MDATEHDIMFLFSVGLSFRFGLSLPVQSRDPLEFQNIVFWQCCAVGCIFHSIIEFDSDYILKQLFFNTLQQYFWEVSGRRFFGHFGRNDSFSMLCCWIYIVQSYINLFAIKSRRRMVQVKDILVGLSYIYSCNKNGA